MAKKPAKKKSALKTEEPVRDDSWGAKHRPTSIEQMILPKATQALLTGLLTKRPRSGALLITGPSGTGKTTIAAILAQAFTRGHSADVIEQNCSKMGGIDNIRELITETRYMPRSEKGSRVVLLDEVQALVGVGQDRALKALLGPLEDASAPVFWILCTDQPQVLPATIMSRVQRIDLKSPSIQAVQGLLSNILGTEGKPIKWPDAEISALCLSVAQNSPLNIRMSCNVLQTAVTQIISMGLNTPKMTYKKAVAEGLVLGTIQDKAEVAAAGDLLADLGRKSPEYYQKVCRTLKGADPSFVLDAMIAAASSGVLIEGDKTAEWSAFCGMALIHFIRHKDAAYLRAGQSYAEQTARLHATLYSIYREAATMDTGDNKPKKSTRPPIAVKNTHDR